MIFLMFDFDIAARDPNSSARLGRVSTPHGSYDTPAFMPVGTCGSIKGVTPDQTRATGTQIVLANTYHLHLRPGEDIVEYFGGVAEFSSWNGPTLTDSGGFQVFSLAEINRIDDDGVNFQSHVDGARLRLDPQISMQIQNKLGADIIMAFDQCPPAKAPREEILAAVDRTIRWAGKCKEFHSREDQWLFGIVQGGLHTDLRQKCAEELAAIGFDGYSIGGLSVGETHEEMMATLKETTPHLPDNQPRYLMGVGMPLDLYHAVQAGVDMFDCVLPTRNGRNAYAFTATGPLKLRNEQYKRADRPMEEGCDCFTCTNFPLGYIRHLFLANEMLGPTLTSIHNIRFFQRFMSRMRGLIPEGNLCKMLDYYPILKDDYGKPKKDD